METSTLRKPLHILLVLAMTASLLATAAVGAFAQTFPDVDPDGPFAEAVEWAVDEGITTGFPDGEFKGTRDITRMALATFYYRLAGEPEGPFEAPPEDVGPENPFYTEISWAVENGVMNPFPDGEFKPMRATVRQAAAAITFQFAGAEGDFAQLAIDAFPDVTETTTFANEIGWLVENGWTDAFADGEWKPNRDVSRFAMAAWFFRIYGPEAPVDALRVVAVDPGVDATTDLVYLSDGSEVIEYNYNADKFEIEGAAASKAAFETFVVANSVDPLGNDFADFYANVLLETRVEGDDVIHNAIVGDPVLEGVLGASDFTPGNAFDMGFAAIVDAPSGVPMTQLTFELVLGDFDEAELDASGLELAGTLDPASLDVIYTVDGAPRGVIAFLENVSPGDYLEVEVLAVDEDGDFTALRHNLTNQTLSGTVADFDCCSMTVDPVAGDAADDETLDLMQLFPVGLDFAWGTNGTNVYVIDGESSDDGVDFTEGDFVDELFEGAEVSFEFSGNVATYTIETDPDPVFEAFSGVVLTGDVDEDDVPDVFGDKGALALIIDGEVVADFTLEPTAAGLTVDGVGIVTQGEFNETIKLGDTLSCTAGELDDVDDPVCTAVRLTPDTFTAQVVAGGPDALVPGDPLFSIDLGLEDPFVVELDVVLEPFGFGGLTVGFTANGQGVYEVDEDTDVLVDSGFILFSIDETPLNDTPVTITLTDEDGSFEGNFEGGEFDYDFLWEFDGFPSDVINAAIANALAD